MKWKPPKEFGSSRPEGSAGLRALDQVDSPFLRKTFFDGYADKRNGFDEIYSLPTDDEAVLRELRGRVYNAGVAPQEQTVRVRRERVYATADVPWPEQEWTRGAMTVRWSAPANRLPHPVLTAPGYVLDTGAFFPAHRIPSGKFSWYRAATISDPQLARLQDGGGWLRQHVYVMRRRIDTPVYVLGACAFRAGGRWVVKVVGTTNALYQTQPFAGVTDLRYCVLGMDGALLRDQTLLTAVPHFNQWVQGSFFFNPDGTAAVYNRPVRYPNFDTSEFTLPRLDCPGVGTAALAFLDIESLPGCPPQSSSSSTVTVPLDPDITVDGTVGPNATVTTTTTATFGSTQTETAEQRTLLTADYNERGELVVLWAARETNLVATANTVQSEVLVETYDDHTPTPRLIGATLTGSRNYTNTSSFTNVYRHYLNDVLLHEGSHTEETVGTRAAVSSTLETISYSPSAQSKTGTSTSTQTYARTLDTSVLRYVSAVDLRRGALLFTEANQVQGSTIGTTASLLGTLSQTNYVGNWSYTNVPGTVTHSIGSFALRSMLYMRGQWIVGDVYAAPFPEQWLVYWQQGFTSSHNWPHFEQISNPENFNIPQPVNNRSMAGSIGVMFPGATMYQQPAPMSAAHQELAYHPDLRFWVVANVVSRSLQSAPPVTAVPARIGALSHVTTYWPNGVRIAQVAGYDDAVLHLSLG